MTGPIDRNGNIHDENGRFVSLRDHIEGIMVEQKSLYTERWEAQRREVAFALREMERRLESLNELRNQVIQDRHMFVTEAKYNAAIEARDHRISALENWRSKATGVALVLALFAGAIGAAVMKVLGG